MRWILNQLNEQPCTTNFLLDFQFLIKLFIYKSMECSRFLTFICFSLSFLVLGTYELQSSQTQVLLQLRKQLEYPKQLDLWLNTSTDFCYLSTPQVNITCQNNLVTGIVIFGDEQKRVSNFNEFRVSDGTLSQNFSMDSLVATLSRLNRLKSLSLVSLGIWGSIPDKIHRLQSLEYLDLSWNFLYGSIPQTLSRIGQLQIVKLDGNFLNGTFPDWFDSFSNFTSLSLRNNLLSGSLPSSIRRITTLTAIVLSNNAISGKLPNLSTLSSLQWLDLSENKFDSELPNMPKGLKTILLNNNSFSGRIPQQYGQLNQLQQIDLSFNTLKGTPPAGLFSLPGIISLNLASNVLSGSLPMRLSCGAKLGSVDISNNKLTGLLPSCLSSVIKTRGIKYGGNCLSIDLSHQHPETYCAEPHEEKKKSEGKNLGVLIGVIVGVIVIMGLLAYGFLVLCRQYCPRGTSEQHLLHKSVQDNSVTGFTSELLTNATKLDSQGTPAHRLFSLDELKAATNNFDKSTLMGEGSTGKMYKGRLENGTQVAIRCLTVSKRYTIRNLKLRLDLLAKLRHPHLVCLLGHCIQNEGKDESGVNDVYLIYEYVPNGNYQARLSEINPEKILKWSDRLAILIGVAKAVHFLHTGIIPGFFNNRLKANNILLNQHQMGKLSDYGLSIVVQESDEHKAEGGLKSWHIKRMEDDVYSFGLILLHSLIGPSFSARNETFLLNEMVFLGTPSGQRRIVDPSVLMSCSQESLSIIISIANKCVSPESSTHPSFEDVLWNLQYAAQVQSTADGEQRS
ncbi:probable inactive leucine-rich repeat receptor-like protein kinase At3g03770 isoform X2 [Olea europaea var. sylvestris]|uniref:Probable inactive leucine-rich repeat receptor kinase At3g03770 n=1 Tax=Olea europaea subsp. europaea TaxID=158383 RepID=A0A8S0PCE1_OLEEU|nr:probable inactive leucine-rich repeat receptor-like protein kinase At3g03770 isoform X2 [Olea europaea var. sylvestris]CAA2933672.1 probable inactive leucine-rich repeat receptor kinase At3g03770 [Olea europaea subsp. europaea]